MLNGLLVNTTKSEVLVTGTHQQVKSFQVKAISVAGECVKLSHDFKFLGVVVDKSLCFDKHVMFVAVFIMLRL